MLLFVASVMSLALAADPTMAPLLATLPADGAWAKHELRIQVNGQEQLLTWSVRSVGTFQQGGKDLRCIETELTGGGADLPPACHRLLVPIDAFGENKHALGETVRMWVRRGEDPIESFDSISGDPVTALFMAGATENVRKLDKTETVEWQRGKLECTVLTGRSTQEIGTSKFVTNWTVLRHKDVPFELAGVRMSISIGDQSDVVRVNMTLTDYGKDAQATLPQLTP